MISIKLKMQNLEKLQEFFNQREKMIKSPLLFNGDQRVLLNI